MGAYDRQRELVIDPLILAFYTFLGGTGDDEFQDIEISLGNTLESLKEIKARIEGYKNKIDNLRKKK